MVRACHSVRPKPRAQIGFPTTNSKIPLPPCQLLPFSKPLLCILENPTAILGHATEGLIQNAGFRCRLSQRHQMGPMLLMEERREVDDDLQQLLVRL